MPQLQQRFVVVGGQKPRITTQHKIPLFERNFIFPFVIACETEAQARSLHPSLTDTLVSLGLPDAHDDPLAFASRIFDSPDISRLEFQSHTKWYPLIRDEIPVIRSIYMQHQELSEAINDSTYSKFRRYHRLKTCLIFMVLSGNEGQMKESGFLSAVDKFPSISHRASPVKTPRLVTVPSCSELNPPPRAPVLALCSPAARQKGKIVQVVEVLSDSDDDGQTSKAKLVHQSDLDHRSSPVKPAPFAAMSVASSSSHNNRLIANEDCNTIWSYIRSLQGVIGVLYQPTLTPRQSASLGILADDYLRSHGYTLPAINDIVSIANSSLSVEAFVDALTAHGFARTEAKFLWDIIDHELE